MADCYEVNVEYGPLDAKGHGTNGGTTYLMVGASRSIVHAAASALESGLESPATIHVARYLGDSNWTVLDARKLLRRLERCARGKATRLGIKMDQDVRTPGPVRAGRVALVKHKSAPARVGGDAPAEGDLGAGQPATGRSAPHHSPVIGESASTPPPAPEPVADQPSEARPELDGPPGSGSASSPAGGGADPYTRSPLAGPEVRL